MRESERQRKRERLTLRERRRRSLRCKDRGKQTVAFCSITMNNRVIDTERERQAYTGVERREAVR